MDPYEEYEQKSNSVAIAVALVVALFFGAAFFVIFMLQTDNAHITQSETYTAEVIAHNSVNGGSEIILDNGDSFRINHNYKYRDMLTPGTRIRYHKEGDGAVHRLSLDIISNPDDTP